MLLEKKIRELITSGREGSYWDFKLEYHSNNADFLHDILCLSNSDYEGDRYIIFGVSDPTDNCEIIGVQGKSRKNQCEIIDFLRSKNFSGDNRPEVELKTVLIESKEIDVLVIINSRRRPFFLAKPYKKNNRQVASGHIYTRTLDVNTPIDMVADYHDVERMWRNRFGIDVQPAQRLVELMRSPADWELDVGNKNIGYHKYFPEYSLSIGDFESNEEIFNYYYPNDRGFISPVKFNYLGTELFEIDMAYLDEMRLVVSYPSTGVVQHDDRICVYYYYDMDTPRGAFLELLTSGKCDFYSRCGEAPFLIFSSREDRAAFENYLITNIEQLDSAPIDQVHQIQGRYKERAIERSSMSAEELQRLKFLYNKWRKNA